MWFSNVIYIGKANTNQSLVFLADVIMLQNVLKWAVVSFIGYIFIFYTTLLQKLWQKHM